MQDRRVTRAGRGEVSPALFENWKKSALIQRKHALTVVIYAYIFSIKMKFLRVSRGKDFFPAGPFFLVLQVNVYRSTLIRRKLLCPKKFLFTHLQDFKNQNLVFMMLLQYSAMVERHYILLIMKIAEDLETLF